MACFITELVLSALSFCQYRVVSLIIERNSVLDLLVTEDSATLHIGDTDETFLIQYKWASLSLFPPT